MLPDKQYSIAMTVFGSVRNRMEEVVKRRREEITR